MIFHWPQLIVIVLISSGVIVSLMKHNEYRGRYNFWASAIAAVIEIWLLHSGGFFNQVS